MRSIYDIDMIPERIKDEVRNKWFYFYRWVTIWEYWLAIRNFLLFLNERLYTYLFQFTVALVCILFFLLLTIDNLLFKLIYEPVFRMSATMSMIWTFFIITMCVVGYIAFAFIKISKIVFTDNHMVTFGKIVIYDDFENEYKRLSEYSKVFKEEMFWESWLTKSINYHNSKIDISQSMYWRSLWDEFMNTTIQGNDTLLVSIKMLAFIWFSAISLAFYLFWSVFFFLEWSIYMVFMLIINWIINREELLISWYFDSIDKSSEKIKRMNVLLISDISKIDEWQLWEYVDKDIDTHFTELSKSANICIKDLVNLFKVVKKSRYSNVINFTIYSNWIKNNVLSPMFQIRDLALKHIAILETTNSNISKQIDATLEERLKMPLILQNKRLESQLSKLKENNLQIEFFIKKLTDL